MTLNLGRPLVTVACIEDMTASNLIGRCLLDADGTPWQDGPLTFAARHGAICDLGEVAEARQDTTVAIDPQTDDRRVLPLEKKGELLRAYNDFLIVISDDPGCQSLTKALKQSTKQRLGAMDFTRPAAAVEARIAAHAADNDAATAQKLVEIGARSRNRKWHGLHKGVSTRMLIHAGRLVRRFVAAPDACTMALVHPITDDPDLRDSLHAAIATWFRRPAHRPPTSNARDALIWPHSSPASGMSGIFDQIPRALLDPNYAAEDASPSGRRTGSRGWTRTARIPRVTLACCWPTACAVRPSRPWRQALLPPPPAATTAFCGRSRDRTSTPPPPSRRRCAKYVSVSEMVKQVEVETAGNDAQDIRVQAAKLLIDDGVWFNWSTVGGGDRCCATAIRVRSCFSVMASIRIFRFSENHFSRP